MAKSAGLTTKSRAFVTHNGDWDTLLVRVGHHLWYNWKKTKDKSYFDACVSVWAAKEAYRAPIRARVRENIEAFTRRRRESTSTR